jgi:hypothetical protein
MARMMINYDKLWDFHGIFRIPQVSEHFQPTIGTCFDPLGQVVGEKRLCYISTLGKGMMEYTY